MRWCTMSMARVQQGADLRQERHRVAHGVLKGGYVEVVIGHPGDEFGVDDKGDIPLTSSAGRGGSSLFGCTVSRLVR
jgi:hypothetical protein